MTGPNLATRAGAAISRRWHPPGAQPPSAEPGAAAAPGPAWPARGAALVRRHWLLAVLLAAGLVLRVLVMAAYHPALIYVDTLKYLYGASPGSEPYGYTGILKVILAAGDLGTVAAVQHVLGLAMAVALYAVLLRRGVARWLAALAAAPVLLDAYELQMEHMIMPDVWFEALIVAGLAVLLWRPAVTVPFAAAAGLILAASATVMQLGVILVVPAAVYLLAAGGSWRRSWTSTTALVLAFATVILGYCAGSDAVNGHFWLARRQSLSGRLVASADCATLNVPAASRALCPTPAQQALGPDWLEHSGQSPLLVNAIPAGVRRGPAIGDLNAAVLSQQPLRVLGAIARDSIRLFALTRDETPGVTPIGRWQFQAGYPTYPPWVNVCSPGPHTPSGCMRSQQAVAQGVAPVSDLLVRPDGPIVVGVQKVLLNGFRAHTLNPAYGGPAQVDRPLARFLRSYQLDGGYTPGPLLALSALVGLAGSLLLASRRITATARQFALASLLFTGTAVGVLLAPDVYQFSWRYELPAVITLLPAGIFGAITLLNARRAGHAPAGDPGAGDVPLPAGGGEPASGTGPVSGTELASGTEPVPGGSPAAQPQE